MSLNYFDNVLSGLIVVSGFGAGALWIIFIVLWLKETDDDAVWTRKLTWFVSAAVALTLLAVLLPCSRSQWNELIAGLKALCVPDAAAASLMFLGGIVYGVVGFILPFAMSANWADKLKSFAVVQGLILFIALLAWVCNASETKTKALEHKALVKEIVTELKKAETPPVTKER